MNKPNRASHPGEDIFAAAPSRRAVAAPPAFHPLSQLSGPSLLKRKCLKKDNTPKFSNAVQLVGFKEYLYA